MNGNDENVIENIAENVGTLTEENSGKEEQITQQEKTYTQKEFNEKLDEVIGKKLARREAKIRKEYENKYGDLENVLKAGTGKKDVSEMADAFREYYGNKGIKIPGRSEYSERDIEVLARAEAEDIIRSGDDEVIEEVNRLAGLGVENMSQRDKTLFKALAEHRQNVERKREFSKLGVAEDLYNSESFKEFASKFKSDTSASEIYEIYNKMQPKNEMRTMGSMKTDTSSDAGVKEFYSYEEASKFSKKDLDDNPKLYEAIVKSMPKW